MTPRNIVRRRIYHGTQLAVPRADLILVLDGARRERVPCPAGDAELHAMLLERLPLGVLYMWRGAAGGDGLWHGQDVVVDIDGKDDRCGGTHGDLPCGACTERAAAHGTEAAAVVRDIWNMDSTVWFSGREGVHVHVHGGLTWPGAARRCVADTVRGAGIPIDAGYTAEGAKRAVRMPYTCSEKTGS